MRARDLSIRTKLILLVGMSAVGFAVFIAIVSIEMKPTLEDSDYNDVVTMKDVRSDVLPPPMYVIEPYLVLYQLGYEDRPATREALILAWSALKSSFEQRRRYWSSLPEGRLKQLLEVDSSATARAIFAVGDNELIPAARAGDREKVRALLAGRMQELYQSHRAAIDDVVSAVNQQSAIYVRAAAEAITRRKRWLAVLGAVVIAGCSLFGSAVARGLARRISATVGALDAVASGDFSRRLQDDSRDDLGVMAAALNQMTTNLGRVVRDVANASAGAGSKGGPAVTGAAADIPYSPGNAAEADPGLPAVSEATRASQSGGDAGPAGAAGSGSGEVIEEGRGTFYEHLGGQVSTLIHNALAFETQRQRAETLMEIDRVKTAFFSNVSHELRTPLTLILGPIEDAIADPSRSLAGERLDLVHRSAVRLLKLVNTLLELSRVEAGRSDARFEATDLAMLTAGLAASFHTLIESAGLRLIVDCPPLEAPVYVDRSQWENIVLNLISNAFKFTLEGQITVSLRAHDGHVTLTVSDTGIGIPEDELPRVFERFHRVEDARGRSFDGTGIGLALVQELAKRHGGNVRVESVVHRGSTFVVTLPMATGPHHDQRITPNGSASTGGSTPYLLEAASWGAMGAVSVPAPSDANAATAPRGSGMRVLVADDNADMREHLVRLLSPRWTVEAVTDGEAAHAAALADAPALILSDLMMPRMDGVALLRALRADARTSTIPFILLSARTEEESVVGGLETGADDYVVKPFSSRQLLSRVATHLEMARVRRAAAEAAAEFARTREVLLADLERKNTELEAFSYSVCHDLRAPLRSIDYFTQLVLHDHGEAIGPTVRDHLQRVHQASQRMGQLIAALLELSRVECGGVRPEPVDLAQIALRIAETLRTSDPDHRVELIVPERVVVDADPRLAEILLENLLGNAWKFTRGKPEPRVQLGTLETDDRRTFYVRDNGAGFDAAFAGRLFVPFQRLHSDREFLGTGIGLATVKRIVVRHGGDAWAEGEPDRGATIYWTLSTPAR